VVTTRAPLGVVGFLSCHVCLTTRISFGSRLWYLNDLFCFYFFYINYPLFNFIFINFSLVILFTVSFGLMRKKKKERERTAMPYGFTLLCAVTAKLCAVCGCVRVSCVGLGVCGLWEGLRPSVSTRPLSAAGLLVSRHWTCQCSLDSR